MSHSIGRALMLAGALVSASSAFAASTASGDFSYKDTKLQVKNAYAIRPHKKDAMAAVDIFLTAKPIDVAAVAAADDAEMAMMKNGKDNDYIRICVTAEGTSCGLFNYSSGLNSSGIGEFKLTTNTSTRIEGSWTMAKPEKFFEETYQFNLKWDADVAAGK
jgi:hypothetical protein